MLFTLGIDSQFGMLEGLVTSLVDMKVFPNMPKDMIIGVIKIEKWEIWRKNRTKENTEHQQQKIHIFISNPMFFFFSDFVRFMLWYFNNICTRGRQLYFSIDG